MASGGPGEMVLKVNNPPKFIKNCQAKILRFALLLCLRHFERAVDGPFDAAASAKIDCIHFLMEGDPHEY